MHNLYKYRKVANGIMAQEKKSQQPSDYDATPAADQPSPHASIVDPRLPKDAQKKLEDIQKKLDSFKDKLISKFEGYIAGVALLPPNPQPQKNGQQQQPTTMQGMQIPAELADQQAQQVAAQQRELNPDAINVLVLIDDTDSQRMSKEELKEKLSTVIVKIAHDIDDNLEPQTLIYSELWQSCYDAKYDALRMVAMSAPVYDLGMLSAIKIAEVHKNMVLKKFEKYIVSYVLAGSLVQGRATATSDIDVFIVIDDTDVKKMTRAELKDKLRAIIIGMGMEAGDMTGIKNKLNIQVYILTDFWDSIKEANPVIFTFLRDGVPFYDRGIFMPWKQLLKMGRIRPSMEAIDIYMSSGAQALERTKLKLKEIAMEDLFWATLTPSQAVLMLHGIPPPTPKETPGVMRDIFVKKEKMLDEQYVKTMEKIIKTRKDLEHGTKVSIGGTEVDELLKAATEYLKQIEQLANRIESQRNEDDVLHIHDTVTTIIRDILRLNKVGKVKDADLIKSFEDEIAAGGEVPKKFVRAIHAVEKGKKDYDAKKLNKAEIEKIRTSSQELIRFLVEYMQRMRGREIERCKIRVKHGSKYGEVLLLDNQAFIIHDIDAETKEVSKAPINKDGGLGKHSQSSLEELEEALSKVEIPQRTFIKQKVFGQLKDIYGKDVEVLINY